MLSANNLCAKWGISYQDNRSLPLYPLLQNLSQETTGFDSLVLTLNPDVVRIHRGHAIHRPVIGKESSQITLQRDSLPFLRSQRQRDGRKVGV